MNIFSWLGIGFLKSQSINTFFLIFLIFFILIWEFFCLINLKGETYELKGFLPPRHNKKNIIPHLGGMIFISLILIIFSILKINGLTKFVVFQKTRSSKEIFFSLWNATTKITDCHWIFNHYLSNIGFILFAKINFLGIYFNYRNQWNLYSKMIILSSILSGAFILMIASNILNNKIFITSTTNFFSSLLNNYKFLSYYGWGLGFIIIQCLSSLLLLLWATKKNISHKIHLYLSITINLIFWIGFNGFTYSIFSCEKNLLFNILGESLLIIFFPIILGGIDDIEKIDKKIIQISYPIKFLLFNFVGAFYGNFYNTLYHDIVGFLSTKLYSFLQLGFIIFFRSILFNAWVNGINFTDGSDGLLYWNITPALIALIPLYLLLNLWKYTIKILGKNIQIISSDLLIELNFVYFIILFLMAFSIFFYFNKRPAKIFMGETGSFGVGAITFYIMSKTGLDFFFFLSMIMVFVQVISVFLQTSRYRIFKKKVFLMAPFHHHLELLNYSDKFILKIFIFINLIGLGLALLLYFYFHPKMLSSLVINFLKKFI
jgi:phospho-N-acetylmuramoyl-pentapeptide-transferase